MGCSRASQVQLLAWCGTYASDAFSSSTCEHDAQAEGLNWKSVHFPEARDKLWDISVAEGRITHCSIFYVLHYIKGSTPISHIVLLCFVVSPGLLQSIQELGSMLTML